MNPPGPESFREAKRQALSELMDGRSDPATVQQLCQDWRQDAGLRHDWLAYHVVGDVLRTSEMASRGAERDAQFMQSLRAKLAAEPVVMAPAASVATAQSLALAEASSVQAAMRHAPEVAAARDVHVKARTRSWRVPLSAAAGVVAMVGMVGLLRGGAVDQPTMVTAATPVVATPVAAPALVVNDQRMLRDPRMDNYLQAHWQFQATGMGGGLQNVSMWSR
jgi:sigma-E factor negative regulatory protein RseA